MRHRWARIEPLDPHQAVELAITVRASRVQNGHSAARASSIGTVDPGIEGWHARC
jgi:hypothetical protein